jgi:hypothetical protein
MWKALPLLLTLKWTGFTKAYVNWPGLLGLEFRSPFLSLHMSISSCSQYATVLKYFWHPSLVMYSFATPPIKVKLGQPNKWGTTNSKPHGPINYDRPIRDMKHQLDHILLHSFLRVHSAAAAVPFTSHSNMRNYAKPKPFSWAKPAYVIFSHTDHSWRYSKRTPIWVYWTLQFCIIDPFVADCRASRFCCVPMQFLALWPQTECAVLYDRFCQVHSCRPQACQPHLAESAIQRVNLN